MDNILGGKALLRGAATWEQGVAEVKRERAARFERMQKHEQCAAMLVELAKATKDYSAALDTLEEGFLSRPFQGVDFRKVRVPAKRIEPKR